MIFYKSTSLERFTAFKCVYLSVELQLLSREAEQEMGSSGFNTL